MYYFCTSYDEEMCFKARTVKELKEKIEKSDCLYGEIYRGNSLYALAEKEERHFQNNRYRVWVYENVKK